MKATDAVKLAAERVGIKTTEIGPKIGRSYSYFAATVSRGSTPKADNLAAMFKACGYTLCAVPDNRVPKSAIAIDPNIEP